MRDPLSIHQITGRNTHASKIQSLEMFHYVETMCSFKCLREHFLTIATKHFAENSDKNDHLNKHVKGKFVNFLKECQPTTHRIVIISDMSVSANKNI